MPNSDFGNEIIREIDSYYSKVERQNPLFVKAAAGEINPQQVCEFLDNLYFLIQHTAIFLRSARRICIDRDMNELGDFFFHKIKEETGHEQWAVNDIRELSAKFGVSPQLCVSRGMQKMVNRIRYHLERNPSLYLGYIFLAEYGTVRVGGKLMQDLKMNCGIQPQDISVISNHVELDQDHYPEMLINIDRFITDNEARTEILTSIREYMEHHNEFCKEIGISQSATPNT